MQRPLRRSRKPVVLAANKTDDQLHQQIGGEPDIDYQALIETTDPDQMPGQYQIPTNPTTNSTDPDSTTIEEDNRP